MAKHEWILLLAAMSWGCSTEETTAEPAEPSPVDAYEPATIDGSNIEQLADMSAPQIFATGLIGFFIGGFAGEESACPKVTESDTQTVIEGGCTDEDGQSWHGKAVAGPAGITYDGFGFSGSEPCDIGDSGTSSFTIDGSATMAANANDTFSFTVKLTFAGTGPDPESCTTSSGSGAIDYAGSIHAPDGGIDGDGPSTWNGSGRVAFDGFGRVDATTSDEVLDDDVCTSEAISGKTTIASDTGDVVVIAYDGATDCDPESTVTWSLNGADQGELAGVACTAGRGRGQTGAAVVLALAGVALARRRRNARV